MKLFKNMTDEHLDMWLEKAHSRRESLTEKIVAANKEAEKRRQQREEQEMCNFSSEDEEIKYFLFEDGDVSGKRYDEREHFWREKGFLREGYFFETEQVAIKLMLYKDRSTNDKTIENLKKILPFVKENPKSKEKVFGVFERTLSAHGVYNLIFDSQWHLIKTTYGREETLESFDTTEEMVEYVSQNHYYEVTQ